MALQWGRSASGLYVPSMIYAPRRHSRPTCIDLFCGCGGMSLGFIEAGFEVLAGLDNDPAAAVTYLYNLGSYPVNIHFVEPEDKERLNHYLESLFKDDSQTGGVTVFDLTSGGGWIRHNPGYPPVRHFWFGDARKITGKQILDALGMQPGEVDCVVGGPPCQGFSKMNTRRNVMDPRNSLVFEFARLVLEIRPKAMMFENVPGILDMVTPEGIPVIDAFCRVLEDGGFGTYNALKRSLLATSGMGAALRSNSKPKDKQDQDTESREKSEQPSLFKEAV